MFRDEHEGCEGNGKRRGWRRQVEASSGNSSLYSIGKSDPLEFYAQMFKVSGLCVCVCVCVHNYIYIFGKLLWVHFVGDGQTVRIRLVEGRKIIAEALFFLLSLKA